MLDDRGSDEVGVARGSTTGTVSRRQIDLFCRSFARSRVHNPERIIEACTFPTMDVQIMCLADVKKQWNNSVDSSCPPIGSISVLLSALQCYGLDSRTSRTCITWVRLRPRVTMVCSYLPTHALVKRDSAETFPSAVEEKSPNISPAPPPPKPKQWVTPESRATLKLTHRPASGSSLGDGDLWKGSRRRSLASLVMTTRYSGKDFSP